MYMIKEDSFDRLNKSAQELFLKLQASQFWFMLKDEPLIKNFLEALREVEAQCKKENTP